MAKLVDVWIFDWDKYSPDDLVQKDDSFQLGPALLQSLVKKAAPPLAVLALGCVGRDQDQADQAERNGGQQQCQRCTPPNVRFGSLADKRVVHRFEPAYTPPISPATEPTHDHPTRRLQLRPASPYH